MTDASGKDVAQLIESLAGKDAVARQQARTELVKLGTAAVPQLMERSALPNHIRDGKLPRPWQRSSNPPPWKN